jgi:acetolactate synthase-1/2/3 large subunit
MDVNEAIVKVLEDIGVDHVFGGSGQVNASMLLALKKSKKIKTIIIRNEQAASFMACGFSMFSDKLGVCFATGGPGAFNLFSGLAVAYYDSLPVLAVTGYTSLPNRGKGALNESTGLNRTPDSQVMFSATTKKSFIVESADCICDILEEAINTAFAGRPGPVHIHVPKNITGAEVTDFRRVKLDIKLVVPNKKKIKQFAQLLAQAIHEKKRIMALVGYGTLRSHAGGDVLEFIERYQIPFATTMDAKGVLSENHPLSLGVYGTSGDPGANRFFDGAEIVLSLGNSFAQNATFGFKEDLYNNKTLLHINIDKNEINKVYEADYFMVSDIKAAITGIDAEMSKLDIRVEKKKVQKDRYAYQTINYTGSKIHPAEIVKVISKYLPENASVMGDAGSHMLWLNCYLDLTKNQRYQNPGSFGPMASHVNGSIGVKCAHPDKTVICGCGDGAYLMAGFELLTAVQNNIPVIWIIFNNGEFNVIKKFLLNIYGEHAFMQFNNPDYVLYAQACGATGFKAETVEEFEDAYQKALSLNEPVIIDAHVESEVYPPFGLGKV